MSSSNQLTVQRAVQNLPKSKLFLNRWTSAASIRVAIGERYKLHGIKLRKATISRHLGKLDPNIDCLSNRHDSGVYRARKNQERLYFFQNGQLDPPSLPPFEDSETWTNINIQDSDSLCEYLQLLEVNESRARPNKKRRLDNVDIIDQLVVTTSECEKSIEEAVQKLPRPSTTYWDSPEAHFLFCPQNSEGVMACLIRRDLLLRDAICG